MNKISKLLNNIRQIIKKEYVSGHPLKLEWIVVGLIGIIMLIMFVYNDLKSLTIWGTNILDCIADGNLSKYFEFTSLNIHNIPHQYVSGTLYSLIPWSLWNIPIWILQRFGNVEIVTNCWALLWSKLFLVGCLAVTLRYTYKLVILLTANKIKAKWTIFLSASYVFTYVGVFYSGQNDILICMLGTMAFYYLIKSNNNNNKLFYLLSSFAISVKYFFFLPYFIILLFMEKNIFKIIGKTFIGLIPTIIFNVACYKLPMFLESSSTNAQSSIFTRIVGQSFPIINGFSLSMCLLSLIILMFIAYSIIPKNKAEKDKYIIYLTTASFIILIAFGTHEFYRSLLLMPFLFILFSFDETKFRINIILESIISFSILITTIIYFNGYLFSSTNSMQHSILADTFNLSIIENISASDFIVKNFPNSIFIIGSIFSTIAFAGFMLILFINYPRNKYTLDIKNIKCERYIIWLRSLMIVPFILYLLFNCIV